MAVFDFGLLSGIESMSYPRNWSSGPINTGGVESSNTEGVREFQPGLSFGNPGIKGVLSIEDATPFRVATKLKMSSMSAHARNPGLQFANAFSVSAFGHGGHPYDSALAAFDRVLHRKYTK